MRYIHQVIVVSVSLCLGGGIHGSTRPITFTPSELVDALHVDFNQDTTGLTNPFGGDRMPEKSDGMRNLMIHNFWGMTVPANGFMLLFDSVRQNLTIDQWWWTLGGNATSDGTRKGPVGGDTGGTKL